MHDLTLQHVPTRTCTTVTTCTTTHSHVHTTHSTPQITQITQTTQARPSSHKASPHSPSLGSPKTNKRSKIEQSISPSAFSSSVIPRLDWPSCQHTNWTVYPNIGSRSAHSQRTFQEEWKPQWDGSEETLRPQSLLHLLELIENLTRRRPQSVVTVKQLRLILWIGSGMCSKMVGTLLFTSISRVRSARVVTPT